MLNYWIGHKLGHKVFNKKIRVGFNKENLERTHQFFEKYGGKNNHYHTFHADYTKLCSFCRRNGKYEVPYIFGI